MRAGLSSALIAALLAQAGSARAAEVSLDLATGLHLTKTEWRGDLAFSGLFKGGLRVNQWLMPYLQLRVGYGSVDQRMLTLLSLGAQVRPFGRIGGVEPYARLAWSHQHEESLSVVSDDPFGALFGIGDGIRHRGGFDGGLGFDFPIDRFEGGRFYTAVELSTVWFYDDRGPHWYVSGGALLGVDYEL